MTLWSRTFSIFEWRQYKKTQDHNYVSRLPFIDDNTIRIYAILIVIGHSDMDLVAIPFCLLIRFL